MFSHKFFLDLLNYEIYNVSNQKQKNKKMSNNPSEINNEPKILTQTAQTKAFFEELNVIEFVAIDKTAQQDLATCAAANLGSRIDLGKNTVAGLVNYIFAHQDIRVTEDSQDKFNQLRKEAQELFHLDLTTQRQPKRTQAIQQQFSIGGNPFQIGRSGFGVRRTGFEEGLVHQETAQAYIRAYFNDLAAQVQGEVLDGRVSFTEEAEQQSQPLPTQPAKKSWSNIDELLGENAIDENKDIVREKIIAVMEKLGKDKLRDLQVNPEKMENVSLLEQIGHIINKLIRGVTFGLAGYEFSDKEAKEALNSGLSANYDEEEKGFFSDGNTRFAQVVNKNIEKRAAAEKVEVSDLDAMDEDIKQSQRSRQGSQSSYGSNQFQGGDGEEQLQHIEHVGSYSRQPVENNPYADDQEDSPRAQESRSPSHAEYQKGRKNSKGSIDLNGSFGLD